MGYFPRNAGNGGTDDDSLKFSKEGAAKDNQARTPRHKGDAQQQQGEGFLQSRGPGSMEARKEGDGAWNKGRVSLINFAPCTKAGRLSTGQVGVAGANAGVGCLPRDQKTQRPVTGQG